MGDIEMREQELPNASDVPLVDASVQHQESTEPVEKQNPPCENGQSPRPKNADDKTPTLPSDVNLSDNQVLSDKPDDKVSADVNTNTGDARRDQVQPNKSNGDATPIQLKSEAATKLPRVESLTPKVEDQNVRKSKNWLNNTQMREAGDLGTPEEQVEFMMELETFHRENALDFKPPKFYGEPLNCLKLWRAVIRLGGYELVTASKLWRQVGESFNPPKTCTTVSWTFRIFYEKALLEYEKHKRQNGELPPSSLTQPTSVGKETSSYQATGSGRARRDAAARAMQSWHTQRLLGYGEVGEPISKDKSLISTPRREKHLKNIGLPKHKIPTHLELAEKPTRTEADKQLITEVVDIGPPADWVKINVRKTKDCFEIYALVPGLLREEVRVQSDPAGRLVITGHPEQLDNPWGITPFQKVVCLPTRINPLQTSAVVTLHGRLFVRVPLEHGSV